MAKSEDPEELLYVWKSWHDATGKRMRKKYVEYVGLMKEVALLNGKKLDKALPGLFDHVDVVGTDKYSVGDIILLTFALFFSQSTINILHSIEPFNNIVKNIRRYFIGIKIFLVEYCAIINCNVSIFFY